MTKEYYEKEFKKGELVDCMPIDLGYSAFILQDMPQDNDDSQDSDELPRRLMVYLPNKNKFGEFGTTKYRDCGLTYVSAYGDNWIVCNQAFMIDEVLKNTSWYDIPHNERGYLAKGITNINGDVYAYGMVRSVFKYKGIKEWENITTETKHPNVFADVNKSKEIFVGDLVGFSALDGFDENDIYAGGNSGDFWHYNGKAWRRIDLPINSDISTITCGKDGKVYIGSRVGNVVIGRDDHWQVVDKRTYIMTHSCWFDGKVYFSSEDGRIYTYDEKQNKLQEASFKTKYPEYMHHLIRGIASCDECLVAYTSVQAYAYDGEIWHEIIEVPELSEHK